MSKQRVELPEPLLPLLAPCRYKVLHGGRGSSKSWSAARALILLAATKPIRVLCARETQKSIQESVHRLLKDQIGMLGLDEFFEVQETKILGRNGSDFAFVGVRQQGVTNLKSFEGTDICWIEEAQVVTKRSWDVLIPTIRKPRSEIWITFNPELDDDETYKRFVIDPPEGAWVLPVNWHHNPWFPAELERERLDMLKRDPVGYQTVWEGKCRPAVEGAIYASEIDSSHREGRVCGVPYDPSLKVHTVWDLGWNDSTAIIFVQKVGAEVRVIDYIEDDHRTLAEYVADISARKWVWGTDYLPHDGAATKHQTGKSDQQVLNSLGRSVQIVPAQEIEQGIRQARMVFPRIYFDKTKASGLLAALKRYRRQVNQQTNEPGAPLHDAASHGADAFRYLCASVEQMTNEDWGGSLKYPKLSHA